MAETTDAFLAFLRARVDEDEAVSLAAGPGPWEDTGPILAGVVAERGVVTVATCNSSDWGGGEYSYPAEPREAARSVHIARHDPARVLREVGAKRRILDAYDESKVEGEALVARWAHGATVMAATAVVGAYYLVLQELATAYSTHPSYREEWKP